ncbi:MAG: hypothetical protein F2520_09340 [Actinobacteria bacterium]|nr:hypothetical protein [Actinomycetota bacterium]MTA78452.1 hypothetical protein [Actinomycetota bacterium]
MKAPLRNVLEASPTLYCGAARLKTGRNREVVTRSSDLLVESFPRSGTTYLVASLGLAAPSVRIASHVHHKAHVQLAVRYGVPSFVLIREPMAACTSATVRLGDQVTFRQMLERWCRYYSALAELPQVQFVSFESATGDTAATVGRVLGSAGLSDRIVTAIDHDEIIAAVEAFSERRRKGDRDPMRVSVPTPERKARIKEVADEFRRQGGELLRQADEIYARIEAL